MPSRSWLASLQPSATASSVLSRRAAGYGGSWRATSRISGVEIVRTPDGLVITLRVVVEHGLNLAEVASTVRSHVGYEVSRLTGIPTVSVDVMIADVRTST